MPRPTRSCTTGRNKSGVEVDLSEKQEFLRYRICVVRGARNDAVIVDSERKVIVDGRHEISARCREREWPKEGQSIDVGEHEHTLVLDFVRAIEVSYVVTLHNSDGSIKQWIKECSYTRVTQEDHDEIGLTVSVS